MNTFQKAFKILSNIQILSALIWAFVIIGSKWISGNSDVSTLLIAAGGIHVILMATKFNPQKNKSLLKS